MIELLLSLSYNLRRGRVVRRGRRSAADVRLQARLPRGRAAKLP